MDKLFIKANSLNVIFREIDNKIVWNIDAILYSGFDEKAFRLLWL